jgi:hypothetical protein
VHQKVLPIRVKPGCRIPSTSCLGAFEEGRISQWHCNPSFRRDYWRGTVSIAASARVLITILHGVDPGRGQHGGSIAKVLGRSVLQDLECREAEKDLQGASCALRRPRSSSFPKLWRNLLWRRWSGRRRPWLDEKGKGPPKIGIVSVRPPPVIGRVIRAIEGSGTTS